MKIIRDDMGRRGKRIELTRRNDRMKVHAAAISLQGVNFTIVMANRDLVGSPGEANMAIDSLQATFGGVPVVLMAQKADGSPIYYGDEELVKSLAGVPIDKMPWKEYSIS